MLRGGFGCVFTCTTSVWRRQTQRKLIHPGRFFCGTGMYPSPPTPPCTQPPLHPVVLQTRFYSRGSGGCIQTQTRSLSGGIPSRQHKRVGSHYLRNRSEHCKYRQPINQTFYVAAGVVNRSYACLRKRRYFTWVRRCYLSSYVVEIPGSGLSVVIRMSGAQPGRIGCPSGLGFP